jgi:predicted ATPase
MKFLSDCGMITRLEIDGFKNLMGVDLQLGPFTCIAGSNGVGKSNLFDAIRFLGNLASPRSLVEAAAMVRDNRRASDLGSIFQQAGAQSAERMRFGIEMIVPGQALDDLGQHATATITFLRYELELGLRLTGDHGPQLEIRHEALLPIKQGEADKRIEFTNKSSAWRKSVVRGARRGGPFVSTTERDGKVVIQRHQDGGSRGNPVPAHAESLKRTIISAASAESPTLLCARREMESWLQLQLEPSALRQPSAFNAPAVLQANGEGLAATLHRIARLAPSPEAVYARVANRMAQLIKDVREIAVDRDEKLDLLTVMLTDLEGTRHPARSLSDGTLRFLALAILEMDPDSGGILCLEEPENGIHPDRIPAMMQLLQDIAVDAQMPLDADNPLRQVLVNTHSPLVVAECPADALVLARPVKVFAPGRSHTRVSFQGVGGTWREPQQGATISRAQLLEYLNPHSLQPSDIDSRSRSADRGSIRIRDREDLTQTYLPLSVAEE